MDVIFPEMRKGRMETSLQKRVRSRMDDLKLNAYQAARKAGLGDSFVRDILRGKTKNPNVDNLAKLADALETNIEWLYGKGEDTPTAAPEIEGLTVLGSIQAGSWIDRSIIGEHDEHEIIPVARDPRFPRAKQYALKVEGDSMDLEFPEGCFVTCVDFFDAGLSLRPGLRVHVERYNGPLVEMTLKAIEEIDGSTMLAPRSSNPRHTPIKLDGDGGTEIRVRGIVTGSYRRTEI